MINSAQKTVTVLCLKINQFYLHFTTLFEILPNRDIFRLISIFKKFRYNGKRFHKNRMNNHKIYTEPQKTLNRQNILEKEK